MKYLVLLILLTSCGASYHLKQSKKHELKAIAKGAQVEADTVFKEIPVIIESVRVDSIFTAKPGDTVYLEKDRLKIKYVRLKADTFYIDGECKADTVRVEVPITVTREIKTGAGFWDIFKIVIFAVVATFLLATFYWKVVK